MILRTRWTSGVKRLETYIVAQCGVRRWEGEETTCGDLAAVKSEHTGNTGIIRDSPPRSSFVRGISFYGDYTRIMVVRYYRKEWEWCAKSGIEIIIVGMKNEKVGMKWEEWLWLDSE